MNGACKGTEMLAGVVVTNKKDTNQNAQGNQEAHLLFICKPLPHSTGRRFRYAHGDLGFSLKLHVFQIAEEA